MTRPERMRVIALATTSLLGGCFSGPSSPAAGDVASAYPCDFKCDDTGACELAVVVKQVTDLRCDVPVDRVHNQARCSFTSLTEDLQTGRSQVQRMSGTYAYRRGKWCSL